MRYFVLIGAIFWLSACTAHDEHYYMLHPKDLQQAINQCPEKPVAGIGCDKIRELADLMGGFALQLRANPQDFGVKILALQEQIAEQEPLLQKDKGLPELAAQLDANKYELQVRLAVVKWLESPAS